jgi:type I restriction enzyme S subunit
MFYLIPFPLVELGNTKYFTTLKNLSNSEFLDIGIVLPPLPEQEQIVSYLDGKTGEIDSTIDSEKKKIDLLKEYRQSLISSVITGKIKVVD